MPDLKTELSAAGLATNPLHLRRLLGLGVPMITLANPCHRRPAQWGVIRARAGEDGLYLPGEGDAHVVLPVVMDGDLVDIVAFRPSAPSEWMLRTGLGWALGLHRGLEPYTWGEPAVVRESPLDWMRADCTGLVVLDFAAPERRSLRCIRKIHCTTDRLTRMMTRQLAIDPYLPEIITVPEGAERKAA
jgi:hypothetical protein